MSFGKLFSLKMNNFLVDFDELLGEQRFNSIEKVKTVGASYMAASGLNPSHRVIIVLIIFNYNN